MAQYFYQARTKEGKTSQGLIEAANESDVYRLIKKKGLWLVSARPTAKSGWKINLPLVNRITLVDRINFTKELSVMIKAGLPIVDALQTIEQQTPNKKVRQIVSQIVESVRSGATLSASLVNHPEFFSEVYVAIVESGEKSGQLEAVFERLGQNLVKDHEVATKIKGALYYPGFILVVMAIVLFIIFSYVLPQLKTIFTDVGVELPIMTKVLLAIGDIFSKYKLLILIGIFGLAIGLKMALRTTWFKNIWDIVQLKIPVFGRFYRLVYNERFARTLSSLIIAGLPMLEILKTCRRVIVNHLYQLQIDQAINEVETGTTLSEAMKNQNLFPSIFSNMIAIGEKTGSTGQVVAELAGYYEREVDQMAKNFTTLIEPVIMVVVGVGVGFLVASVILPIYNLISSG